MVVEQVSHIGLSKYLGENVELSFRMGNKICFEGKGLFRFLLLDIKDEYGNILTDHAWVYGSGDVVAFAVQLAQGIKNCKITGSVASYRYGHLRHTGGYGIRTWNKMEIDGDDIQIKVWRDAGLYRAAYIMDGIETEIRL